MVALGGSRWLSVPAGTHRQRALREERHGTGRAPQGRRGARHGASKLAVTQANEGSSTGLAPARQVEEVRSRMDVFGTESVLGHVANADLGGVDELGGVPASLHVQGPALRKLH